jgi:hypothetical protein
MKKLIAWAFLIIGSFFIGVGQHISKEAYDQWADLIVDEMFK